METDSQLVHRALQGDRSAFSRIIENNEGMVYALCLKYLKDRQDAQDAAQDTFLRAYLKLGQRRNPERLSAWLRRLTHSICMNQLRDRRQQKEVNEETEAADYRPGPEQKAEEKEMIEAVLKKIDELPGEYRTPFRMRYFEQLPYKDISVRLGSSSASVRTRLYRVRRQLKSALAPYWSVEALSRSKETRRWLPANLMQGEENRMTLEYESRKFHLLRGEEEVVVCRMKREDIPALRRFDRELSAELDERNTQVPPGQESQPGGPWSDDEWLLAHFNRYAERGNITLLVEDASGKVVGFVDLWVADEPDPVGSSLDVECIDYFHRYYALGIETVLLQEAEKVAKGADLPALDIGTNTSSGDYPVLRRFGLKVFYEYDHVLCRTRKPRNGKRPERRTLSPKDVDLDGLIKASHWSPTDFTFRDDEESFSITELSWPDHRAVLELWRYEGRGESLPPAGIPNRSELYVEPKDLTSPELLSDVLDECLSVAFEAVAKEIQLPCPSDIAIDSGKVDVIDREFAFAWMRKRLSDDE